MLVCFTTSMYAANCNQDPLPNLQDFFHAKKVCFFW